MAAGTGSLPPAPPALPPEPRVSTESAAALVAPLPPKPELPGVPTPKDTEPQDDVLPQERRPQGPAVRKQPPSRRLEPGDLICGDCGEGNVPSRKFCSRCGGSLAEAEKVKTPWWKRLLPRTGAKVRKSGDRPKRRGKRGRSAAAQAFSTVFKLVRRIVAIGLLLAGIAYGVFPEFRAWVNRHALAAKATAEGLIFPQYEAVNPVARSATAQTAQHPGDHATDGLTNTFWTAPVNGAEPTLVLKYDKPVDLVKAIIRNGARDSFQAQHRAQKLHLVFSTGKTHDIELKDTPEPETLEIKNGEGATSVEIHVVGLHRSVSGTELAISEIELFRER